jgi:hypothetical protein
MSNLLSASREKPGPKRTKDHNVELSADDARIDAPAGVSSSCRRRVACCFPYDHPKSWIRPQPNYNRIQTNNGSLYYLLINVL